MDSCPPVAMVMERAPLRLELKEIKLSNLQNMPPTVSFTHESEDRAQRVKVPSATTARSGEGISGSGGSKIHIKRKDASSSDDSTVSEKKPQVPVPKKTSIPVAKKDFNTPLGMDELHMFSNPQRSRPPPDSGAAAHGTYAGDSDEDSVNEYSEDASDISEESQALAQDNAGPAVFQQEDGTITQVEPSKMMSKNDRRQLKYDLLSKLNALERKGVHVTKRFTSKHKLIHIQAEYNRLTQMLANEAGVKFGRKILMGAVGITEWLNERFDPVGAKLEGWSESVMENIEDFDHSLERIVEKWNSHVEVAPEMELMTALGGSAFMFHMSKSILGNPAALLGNLGSKNPNMMSNMMKKMMSSGRGSSQDDDEEGGMSPPKFNLNPLSRNESSDSEEESEYTDESEDEEDDSTDSESVGGPKAKMISIPAKK